MVDLEIQRRLEKHLEELPVLPTVIGQLMGLNRDADDYFESVLDLIGSEPNFSARLLSAANSVLHAGSEPITTLRGAIARMGSGAATSLLLGSAVTRVFVPRDDWERSLWRHALQVAVAAQALAREIPRLRAHAEIAYAAGLLHDVGRFVMFQEAPEALRRVDEGSWEDPRGLVEAEREICGLDHAALGALACRRWKLPTLIEQIVRDHHRSQSLGDDELVCDLVALVHFADMAMFPSARPGQVLHSEDDDEERVEMLWERRPDGLDLTPAELGERLVRIEEDCELRMDELGIGSP